MVNNMLLKYVNSNSNMLMSLEIILLAYCRMPWYEGNDPIWNLLWSKLYNLTYTVLDDRGCVLLSRCEKDFIVCST